MVLIVLLLIALGSVITGVVLPSVAWLIVSLVASVLAAIVLYWSWSTIKERRGDMARRSSSEKPARAGRRWRRGEARPAEPLAPPVEAQATDEVFVVDGRPQYHRAGCTELAGLDAEPVPRSQALEDGFVPCPTCRPETAVEPVGAAPAASPDEVWVVDGSPEYHEHGCSTLAGRDAEPIPLSQAAEDGFIPCTVCTPPIAPPVPAPSAASAPAGLRQVWVVDGYPEYHHEGCVELAGLPAEPVPYEQAVEDGFQPCVVCNPDREFAAAAPAGAPAGQVWVVDGSPEYHRADCRTLAGRPAEPVPHEQAVEDGFVPCTVCEPDRAAEPEAVAPEPVEAAAAEPEVPAATVAPGVADEREVWVADGYPDYHVAGCHELTGLDALPIPHSQAVEDGFTPCPVCRPEAAEAAPAAVAPPAAAAPAGAPASVWVADGFPDYHRAGCRELIGLDAVEIPHDQAVEDGFAPCAVCQPEAAEAPELAPDGTPEPIAEPVVEPEPVAEFEPEPVLVAEPASAALAEVWVADGYPDYHRAGCPELAGLDAVAIPHGQAVEDGFAPCAVCEPEAAEAPELAPAGAPEPVAEPVAEPVVEPEPVAEFEPEPVLAAEPATAALAEVWVADGYPDYHREGCTELTGLDAVRIPHDQAVEDGFAPCVVCQPEAAEPGVPAFEPPAALAEPLPEPVLAEPELLAEPEAAAEPEPVAEPQPAAATLGEELVWVADGYPDFHREGCRELAGLDAIAIPFDQAVEDDFQPCEVCQPHLAAVPPAVPEPTPIPEPLPELVPELAPEPEPVTVSSAADLANQDVWVVDGYPDFHLAGCRELVGLDDDPVPYEQAVEDGFSPCPVCLPELAATAVPTAAPEPAAELAAEPLPTPEPEPEPIPEPIVAAEPAAEPEPEIEPEPVVTAQPSIEPEPVPTFAPEPIVEPAPEPAPEPEPEPIGTAAAPEPVFEPVPVSAAEPEPVSTAAQPEPLITGAASGSAHRVWVVDGRPRYHEQDCLIIKGQNAQSVPFDQAVEDGFMPCSLCQRKR